MPTGPGPPSRRDVAVAGHTGDADTARRGLDSATPAVRATALGALDRLGDLGDVELAAALTDPSATVRRRAAAIAAHHPAVDLLPALSDDDATVVEVAAWATGERPAASDAVLTRLLALTVDADEPLVREAAVAALGALGDDRALPVILRATTDRPAIRRRAVLALAPFDGPAVDAALTRALGDRDWQVRQAAEDLQRARR